MKIVVTNAVVSNSGDAAIFAGIHAALVKQGVAKPDDITLLDSNARRTARLYPQWNVLQQISVAPPRRLMKLSRAISRLRRAFTQRLADGSRWAQLLLRLPVVRRSGAAQAYRALNQADLVISTGGTYLVDHYDFSHRAAELELARRAGNRVVLWTQSVGPFQTPRARGAIKRIIACVDAAYFRDKRSREAWLAVGGDPLHSFVTPDAAFAIEPTGADSTRTSEPRVLISVREWPHRGANGAPYDSAVYEAAMRSIADLVSSAGDEAIALSTCQGLEGYVDDSAYAARLFSGMHVTIDTAFHTPEQLIAELKRSRLVVTTRMHLAILALVTGVPVIAVAYEFKTKELFEGLGLGRFVVTIEEATPAWMQAAYAEATEHPEHAKLSEARLALIREAATAPAQDLAS